MAEAAASGAAEPRGEAVVDVAAGEAGEVAAVVEAEAAGEEVAAGEGIDNRRCRHESSDVPGTRSLNGSEVSREPVRVMGSAAFSLRSR